VTVIDKDNFLLSVVMPVCNEADTIRKVIDRVNIAPYRKEIIAGDDGSSDGTLEILEEINHDNLTICRHDSNYGKGRAIQTGFSVTTGDIVIIQDADLEYDPDQFPALLNPILTGKADVVYGSRLVGHGEQRVLYFWHYVGNRFLTLLSNVFTNINLTDMETGYKAFTRQALDGITIKKNDLGSSRK